MQKRRLVWFCGSVCKYTLQKDRGFRGKISRVISIATGKYDFETTSFRVATIIQY